MNAAEVRLLTKRSIERRRQTDAKAKEQRIQAALKQAYEIIPTIEEGVEHAARSGDYRYWHNLRDHDDASVKEIIEKHFEDKGFNVESEYVTYPSYTYRVKLNW